MDITNSQISIFSSETENKTIKFFTIKIKFASRIEERNRRIAIISSNWFQISNPNQNFEKLLILMALGIFSKKK